MPYTLDAKGVIRNARGEACDAARLVVMLNAQKPMHSALNDFVASVGSVFNTESQEGTRIFMRAIAAANAFEAAQARQAPTTDARSARPSRATAPSSPYGPEVSAAEASRPRALTVALSSAGNPDRGQDPLAPVYGVANARKPVCSLDEAAEACREFISANDLGGGNWTGGAVFDARTNKLVARVSYNGRIWEAPEAAPRKRREAGPER